MIDELRLIGPLTANTGYSKMTRAILRACELAGFKVQALESDYSVSTTRFTDGRMEQKFHWAKENPKFPIPDIQREDVRRAQKTRVSKYAPTLMVQIMPGLESWQHHSYAPRIGWSMFESNKIHPDWLRAAYGVDRLIMPSTYCWHTLQRHAPDVPSQAIPIPVDDRIFNTDAGECHITGRNLPSFCFFSVFTTTPRKGWQTLMQAHYEEFRGEDCGLVVRPSRTAEVNELANWLNKGAAKIVVLQRFLTDDHLAAYYRWAHCYALPSSEGFGLPFVEAALCGTPSVALDKGGAADIVNPINGYPVKSRMEQVIGHMPMIYTSDHRFAVAGIREVRKSLRRAYEEITAYYKEARNLTAELADLPDEMMDIPSNRQKAHRLNVLHSNFKGNIARQHALMQYTPAAIAPRIREAVEQSYDDFKHRTRMWTFGSEPRWALLVGDGFGDALSCLGNIQSLGCGGPVNVLHYGSNRGLKGFLELQSCVKSVKRINPKDRDEFARVSNEVGGWYARPPRLWLPQMLKGTGIKPEDVALTQVHWPWATWPIHRPDDVRLSKAAEEWAEEMRRELGEFILVQPYSISSVQLQDHWPHWTRFLKWLIEATSNTHRLVFCGQNEIPGLSGENVVDLVNKTPSMMHVFALADRSKGCITTCNALANWAAVRGIRALIAGNAAIPHPSMYWPRFMTTKNTRLFMWTTKLDAAQKMAQKFLQETGK